MLDDSLYAALLVSVPSGLSSKGPPAKCVKLSMEPNYSSLRFAYLGSFSFCVVRQKIANIMARTAMQMNTFKKERLV